MEPQNPRRCTRRDAPRAPALCPPHPAPVGAPPESGASEFPNRARPRPSPSPSRLRLLAFSPSRLLAFSQAQAQERQPRPLPARCRRGLRHGETCSGTRMTGVRRRIFPSSPCGYNRVPDAGGAVQHISGRLRRAGHHALADEGFAHAPFLIAPADQALVVADLLADIAAQTGGVRVSGWPGQRSRSPCPAPDADAGRRPAAAVQRQPAGPCPGPSRTACRPRLERAVEAFVLALSLRVVRP